MIKELVAKLIVNEQSTLDFGVYIQYPIVITHPQVDVTSNAIPGHSGDLLTKNHRFQNISQSFTLYATRESTKYSTWSQLSMAINDWLVSDKYQPLYLDTMHEWYWEAILSQPANFTPQNDSEATATVTFNCKPYMRSTDSMKFRPLPSSQKVINKQQESAEPIIHIVGSGDFVLSINDQDFKLNGVDGEIFVDSEEQWIYKHDFKENRASCAVFPNNDFPSLKPGENKIYLKSGTAQKIEYKPNWRRLA